MERRRAAVARTTATLALALLFVLAPGAHADTEAWRALGAIILLFLLALVGATTILSPAIEAFAYRFAARLSWGRAFGSAFAASTASTLILWLLKLPWRPVATVPFR